jgi:DNA invertase Pin-like site-specific DNA recombinase
MNYAYYSSIVGTEEEFQTKLQEYTTKNSITIDEQVNDESANKMHWEKRKINQLIYTKTKPGDVVIAYEAASIARSTLQVLEVLELLSQKGVALHFMKYDSLFLPEKFYKTEEFLKLVKHVESDFVARRTTDALARRRAAGLPLGRPKGRKNKTRKLDKYREEIKKYMALGINKASIAKLVGCHAQTLYNYLEDYDLINDASVGDDFDADTEVSLEELEAYTEE